MYLRTEVHLNRCKAAVDEDKGRRRREDSMVEIRKNKRKENLQKKRLEAVAGGANQFPLQTNLQSASANEKKLENLCAMVEGVWSDNKDLQLEATTQFRTLLSIERSPPIDEVIQSGVVPRFVYFLGRDNFPQLQLEAARALTNIASGTSDHTRVVIKHKAVPIFVKLLASPSDDVREHAVWALGNVAGDSPECRDFVLEQGALIPLLDLINEHTKLSIMRKATWTLFNLCRGKPRPSFDQTRHALPALRQLIHSKDEQVLTHACWALSYLSDGTNDKIRAVIKSNVCPRLVELLNHSSHSVRYPALRTVGNIAAGDTMQTQYIIDHQALPCLFNMLSNDQQKSIKKEACWTISNITAGNEEQIQDVIDAKIVGPLVCLLQNAEIDIKKEAACAISNAIYGGSHDQIKYLVDQGCIKPLCDLLICPDPRIVTVCLDGLENILKFGEVDKILGESGYVNQYAQKIDEGWTKIKNLHNKGYKKATKLLETYYKEEVQKPVEEEKKVEEEAKPAAGDEKKAEESKDPPPPPPPQEVVLRVFMHCEGCARKVRRCLKGFDGVEDVVTDCKTHKVVVKGEKADPMKVLERVQKKSHRKVELLSPVPKPPEEEPKKPGQEEPPKPEEKKR